MKSKALLLDQKNFCLISFLHTGYWHEEKNANYYNDGGKIAQGDLVGQLIILKDCIPIILEEFFEGLYKQNFKLVIVEKSNFNRKFETKGLNNWVGWTCKHKKYSITDFIDQSWQTKHEIKVNE